MLRRCPFGWSRWFCGIDLRNCRTLFHISTELNRKLRLIDKFCNDFLSIKFIYLSCQSNRYLVFIPFGLVFLRQWAQWEKFVTCIIGKTVQFQFFSFNSKSNEFIVFGNLLPGCVVNVATITILNTNVWFTEFCLN